MAPERSIRNIQPTTRTRTTRTPRDMGEAPQRRKHGRWGIWIAALAALIVVGGAGALMLFPSTTIDVTPHTQTVPFDPTTQFTAVPENGTVPGSITYAVTTQSFDDSAVVAANGVEHVDEKATGVITVYNSYSASPVRLIKNTRFETPDGLVFRIPASVDVPGKKGTTPGSIDVTVFADQTGVAYNVGPITRLTLPGLKSTPDMYAGVYAKSDAAFTGGFSGDRPAVAQATLDAAVSEVRSRLNEKAMQLAQSVPEGSIAFPGLISISYESLAPTTESDGSVRIHEKATVMMPVFPEGAFSQSIAQAVSANAEGQSISLRFADGVAASTSSALSPSDLGQKPLVFSLSGTGQLVWNVDADALKEALAGREEAAFQTIVQGFPAVEEAKARITPFWKHTFPTDPAGIAITVEAPPQPF